MDAATAERPMILSAREVRAARRVRALLNSEAEALHAADDGSGVVSRIFGELDEVMQDHVVPLAPAEQWAA